MSVRVRSRLVFPALLIVTTLPACSDDSTSPRDPVRQDIVVSASAHHIGDNAGAEGTTYSATFNVSSAFDSATVSISFLYPNAFNVSGPEVDAPPQITLNGNLIGISTSAFPTGDGCITGTGPGREYSCNITFELPATNALQVGSNTIGVASEAATGGDDDFVFSGLAVTVWR